MADRDLSEFSRLCPSCGRRGPRAVAQCRCGADLPPDESPTREDAPQSPARSFSALMIGLAAAALAAGYWVYTRPAPAAPDAAVTAPAVAPAGDNSPAGASPDVSPERRAWEAAAKMEEPARDPRAGTREPGPDSATTLSADPALAPALEVMVDRAMPAIVLVETSSGRGSAFFVQHDTLITNVHVVQNDGYVTLRRMDGATVNARVHSRAPAFDIAVLKVATPSPSQAVLPMGTAQSLKPGQEVIVIGSALGTLQNSVSRGIVSGLRQSGGVTLIQSDAAANPGNSGGPMLDRSGRVVGVLTAGYRGQQGLNFAVSIDHARDIVEGRQANLGTTQTGLANIKPLVPGATESDQRQQQGEQEFLVRVNSAAEGAAQLDAAWQRFRGGCYKNPISGAYDREWFVLFTPRGLPGDAAAGCVDYFQSMRTEMMKFQDYMRTTVGNARRANLLPGTIRDTLRAKRLNFDW
jgi:S1-C subfamily serine protease